MHPFRLVPHPARLLPPNDPLWARLDERPVKARLTLAWMRASRANRLSRVAGASLGELPTDIERVDDRVEFRIAGVVTGSVLVEDLLGGVG